MPDRAETTQPTPEQLEAAWAEAHQTAEASERDYAQATRARGDAS